MALIIHVNVNGILTVCVFQEFDQSLELDTFLNKTLCNNRVILSN